MMAHRLVSFVKQWMAEAISTWEGFWFTPRYPHVLAILRVVTGAMLLYCHLVLAGELSSFLGDHAWINHETAARLHDGTFGPADWGRSYLWHIRSPLLLNLHHGLTLVVVTAFAAGLLTRLTAPAAWFLQLMYLHRLTGTLFGLDQIVTYLTMALMLTPCGACFSLDALIRRRFTPESLSNRRLHWLFPEASPSVAATIGTRIFQIHLCVIYFFGGVSKARGELWWDGTATWFAAANYEYQSLDMTWLSAYPLLFSALTHITLFWEIGYAALIWPRLSRPLVLLLAVAVHGGIAISLGMVTFGTMMIAANMIFIEPRWLIPGSRDSDASSRTLRPADV